MAIQAVLVEFTRSTCCRNKGDRKWVSNHLAKAYVNRRIAKIIKRKKPKVINAKM